MNPDPVLVRLRWSAACAGLALVAWLVLLAGPGSGAPALPGVAAGDAAALPALDAGGDWRLEPPEAYAEIALRPLFAQDRQPAPFVMAVPAAEGGMDGLRLTGVVIGDGFAMATVSSADGRTLHLHEGGDAVAGWRLLELAPGMATLQGPGGVRTLVLQPVDPPAAGAYAAAAGARAAAAASSVQEPRGAGAGATYPAGDAVGHPGAGAGFTGQATSGAEGTHAAPPLAGSAGAAGAARPPVAGPSDIPTMPSLPGGQPGLPDPSVPSFGLDIPVSLPGVVQDSMARSTRDRIQNERNRLRQLRDGREHD